MLTVTGDLLTVTGDLLTVTDDLLTITDDECLRWRAPVCARRAHTAREG